MSEKWTGDGDYLTPFEEDRDDGGDGPQTPPRDESRTLYDMMRPDERGMSQPSGTFPALYDGVKKKPTKKPKR